MNRILHTLLALALLCGASAHAAGPLRVYIRAGAKTHGPGQHDHPRFLTDWQKLLTDRGAKAEGGLNWPTAQQFENTDVVVVFAPDPWDVTPEQRADIEKFTQRGGGIVVLHDGLCGKKDPEWVKSTIGGAWTYGKAKWFEGDISFYYVNNDNPITQGASNFDVDDEMYYELDMDPAAKVLAATWTPDQRAQKNGRAFPHIYNEAPQMWTFEKGSCRAFVDLLGHNYSTLEMPQVRAVLLRGIAWAGKRDNLNELCSQDELASLRYPAGGPSQPVAELAKLVGHPDFKTTLVAAEPLINKPIAIDWDPRGRIWVAETPEYPNGRRGMRPEFAGAEWKDHGGIVPQAGKQERPAHDRISVLVDTDGDGIADKKEIFYEGLELVTGFVFYKDGVIAVAAPDVWWIRDTNGDGKADKVERLYTGLGTRDTHAVINNARWGMDGWIYATHGYSASPHVTSGDGGKDFGNIGSGVVRFKPDGSAFEQYSSKGGNTWGLTVTWDNEVMWTQPTSGDLLMHTVLPEHLLARGKVGDTTSYKVVIRSPKSHPLMTWEQQAYRQIDWVGSFTAAAGCAIYDGGTWPAEWNGSYFTTEPTINIVHQEFVTPEGVSFAAHKQDGREETEFMTSRDMWFRPIEARTGPDGALYILDFYNQAVIHNDTRGPVHNNVNAAVRPDRDHYFGRILRVDHKDAKKIAPPDLSKADAAKLVEALSHSDQAVRMTAGRLLVERREGAEPLLQLAANAQASAPARIQALWTLERQGKLTAQAAAAAIADKDEAVSRNALKIAAQNPALSSSSTQAALAKLQSPEPRTRLAAILALGASVQSPEVRQALVAAYPTLNDHYLESALLGVANQAPAEFIATALQSAGKDGAEGLQTLIGHLASSVRTQPEAAARLVQVLAAQPSVGAQAALILARLSEGAKAENAPAWTPELQQAFRKILNSPAGGAAVPLIGAWDKQGTLAEETKAIVQKLIAKLDDAAQPEEVRAQIASSLVNARRLSPDAMNAVARLLGSNASPSLQRRALEEIGGATEPSVGALLVELYPKVNPALQDVAFAQVLKRSEWTRAFVDALKGGALPLTGLGPIALDKLRHYPDGGVAQYASQTIDALRGPMVQQKDKVIAALLPKVEDGGDPAKGKQLFTGTCAVCHRFNGEGANLAPELSGMGAHPRAELLTHIVDPNREVDPSFAAYDFQTKTSEVYQGIIVRENAQTVLVRDAAGEHELKKSDIASRRELGRSLMPEGFEALGAETLRDIIAYLQSGDAAKYRIVDLRGVFTADSRRGLFSGQERATDTLKFKKFGNVKASDIPFVLADPGSTPSGKNLIVLKGGEGFSKTYPQKVEIPVGRVQANILNILGGVGGWAFPCCGDEKGEGLPAAKVTVVYEDGSTEELVFKNGVEFADYINVHDVPGSTNAAELVNGRQIRLIRKPLAKGGVITKLILESYDNRIAPLFAAITAEKGDAKALAASGSAPAGTAPGAPATAPKAPEFKPQFTDPVPQPPAAANGTRVLLVGGGSSHDFTRWFGQADKATLGGLNPGWVEYTQNANGTPAILPNVDVLVWSANQPIASETCAALMKFANEGKGIIPFHPGTWYAWNNFPQWNKEIVGGGTRGHDKFGEFDVQVVNRNHPITAGLPEKFHIADELYNFVPDPQGTPIEVLATATSPTTGKTFPQVWIVKHPKARIVCITLGHDAKAHELPEFKTLLQNAVRWASGK